jgi:small GTP-binding protein
VRLTGHGVAAFLQKHFSATPQSDRGVHGVLSDGSRVIDDPLVVLLPGGRGADINVHGGTWVVRSLLDLAEREGFQIEQHSIAAALPAARTEIGLCVLLAQKEAWERFKSAPRSPADIQAVLADETLWHLLNPPTVAIVGAANVGKSTLANQLFGQERSITADLPGTTRDWVGEIANIDGLPIMLIDTPGQRETADEIEQAAIARSRPRIAQAQCVVLVLDATRPLEPEQLPLLQAHPNAIRVANKCDQPWAWETPGIGAIRTVATTGDGLDELRRVIAGRFGCCEVVAGKARWWTERHKRVLIAGIKNLDPLAEI